MPDVLISDVSGEDLDMLDGRARRVGLFTNEYVRRMLQHVARRHDSELTAQDLAELADVISDLGDESVTGPAWA